MKFWIFLLALTLTICSVKASSDSSSSESCESDELESVSVECDDEDQSDEQDSVSVELCDDEVCKKSNEEWSICGNHPCQATCEEPSRTYNCSFEGDCWPGCICADGYLRNKDGDCVPRGPCELSFCTRENEEYKECGTFGQRTCDNYNSVEGPGSSPVCVPGCFCKDGYVRDANWNCILPELCIRECPENEEFSYCISPCSELCENLGDETYCDPIVDCYTGCDCKPAFYRNHEGVCVRPEECVAPENEEYNPSFYPCPPQTCDAIGKTFECQDDMGMPAWQCKRNYRRDSLGVCVPIEECPPLQCPDNEVYNSCPPPCYDDTCISLYVKYFCNSILLQCNPRCVCQEGYLRNKAGVCIPTEQCEPPCKENESYNACPPKCPPEETCDNYLTGLVVLCVPEESESCVPRCDCAEGFVRKELGGECIRAESCCEDPNAEVVSCPNPCPGGTCASPKFADCKAPCKLRGCQCKEGYVKDDNGKCILLEECPPPPCECGENEEYNPCGTACPRTCENKDEDISCTEQCVPGCFCKEGLVRKNGVCVDPKDCGCGENEVFSLKALTVQETCETRGQKNKCKKGPGCICMDGYVRKCEKGPCIKIEDCECE